MDCDSKHKCIICKNNKFALLANSVRDSKDHKILVCSNCKHIQLSPLPSKYEYDEFYEQDKQMKYIGQTKNISRLRMLSKFDNLRRAKLVDKLVKSGSRILDIGAGYGFFMEEMLERGYECSGFELSTEKLKKIKSFIKSRITKLNIAEEIPNIHKQDCVTLFFLLEHIINPVDFCARIGLILSPEGFLVVEVPNVNSNLMQINKSYKDFFWQRAHISYFDETSLRRVLRKAGYKNVKILYNQRYGINNFLNWMINNKPQIKNPEFGESKKYPEWDRFYRKEMIKNGKSDTIIAIAQRGN